MASPSAPTVVTWFPLGSFHGFDPLFVSDVGTLASVTKRIEITSRMGGADMSVDSPSAVGSASPHRGEFVRCWSSSAVSW